MNDYLKPASPRERVLAGVVDFGLSGLVLVLVSWVGLPVFGMLITTAYILFRDSMDGQSLGKKWRGLCVVNLRTELPGTWMDSLVRNLVVGIPVLGYVAVLVEGYYAVKDSERRRYGDFLAHTLVIDENTLREEEVTT